MAEGPFPVKIPIDDLKAPCGVALNQAGEIIVTEEGAGIVSIFSPTGDKLRTLDTRGTAFGAMKDPRGVAVDGEDNILVVDRGNRRLLKFSRGGVVIGPAVDIRGKNGQVAGPDGVCVSSVNGEVKVYVVDSFAERVTILTSNLTVYDAFGTFGNDNGQFYSPRDVASDRSGCVYVADASNNRVQVFKPDGGYLTQFGKKGSQNGELDEPISICVDSDDRVYVGEYGNHRVSVFTCEGVFLKSFGSEQINRPFGIAVDQHGVYVSDLGNNNVQIFSYM